MLADGKFSKVFAEARLQIASQSSESTAFLKKQGEKIVWVPPRKDQ
jgi:hypothetical protein